MSANGVTKSSNSLKHSQQNSATTNANHSNSNNNHTANTNLLSGIGHNASPILPMTPTSSVSPPINVTFKKETGGYHTNMTPGLSDVMKTVTIHDAIKEEMNMCASNPSAYPNINARLGHGGNLTPLGSNSSIMTTPSPPITPSHNAALSYVPNHDAYLWHPQYNQYGNNYNPSPYYSQMDYQSQNNYGSVGHSGYSMSNLGLPSGASFNGTMASQPFTSNGMDYMAPQDNKYVNMV